MKKSSLIAALATLSIIFTAAIVSAQGAQVPFAGLNLGPESTVEVTADTLSIDQTSGTAIFRGNVVAGIENMRLTADVIEVVYTDDSDAGAGPISRLVATGNVFFSNGEEAAEGDHADLDLETNEIIMTGNVVLTQGKNALSGQKLRINLDTGTAFIEGRVQSIFQTGASE